MTNIITFLRNYDYDLCLAKGNKWTLEEAVDYLAAYLVNNQVWKVRDDAYKEYVSIRDQIVTAVRHGIDEGRLVVEEEYNDNSGNSPGTNFCEIDFRRSLVIPTLFINWAIDNNIEVPQQYKKYADKNKTEKANYYEGLGVKKIVIHHERCRAVAELLWSVNPDIPIAEMARSNEIIQIGCEGDEYDIRTISRWLASLKPGRWPGRPKKKAPALATSSKSECYCTQS